MAGSDLVQSVTRGMQLIELAAGRDHSLTVSEAADWLEVKTSTAHNLLRTLAARSFLEKAPGGSGYRLGPALSELLEADGRRRLLREGEGQLLQLRELFPAANAILAESSGNEVVIALRHTPDRPGVVQRPRSAMNPYASASSLLFQAYWPEEKRAAYRRSHPLADCGGHRWTGVSELDVFLRRAAEQGFVCPEFHKELFLVAAPVFGRGEAVVAALGLSAPRAGFPAAKRKRAIAAVVKAAGSLSEERRQ